MTTNSEHRRRETDKVDQISLKYQLEKAEERIAEFEDKANSWDYYQELVKSKGFDGFTDLLVKYDQLRQRIEAADKQEPIAVLYRTGGVLTKEEIFEICCRVETPLYALPPTADKNGE